MNIRDSEDYYALRILGDDVAPAWAVRRYLVFDGLVLDPLSQQGAPMAYYVLQDREVFLAALAQRWGKGEVLDLLLSLEG